MKTMRARLMRAAVVAAVLQASLTLAAEPPAIEETIDMSVAVGNGLSEVMGLMDARQFAEAEAALQRLRAMTLNDYEKSRVLQTSAQLNLAAQQYPEAIADYEAILQTENLPEAERVATIDVLGQVHLQVQDWDSALGYLLDLNQSQGGSNMETLFRIAFSYSQLGKPAEAIPYMEQAIVQGGAGAGEAYYSNMATLYMAVKDDAHARATLEQLIQKFPDSANRASYQQNLDILNARAAAR
ncbi:MAG: Tetratrico peptide repeat [Pseudomonadota bacterium]